MPSSKTIVKTFPYLVRSLDRAMDILDGFSFQTRHMNLSEIVRKTGLNITTAKRLISNLTQRGYLRQDPDTKQYYLGLRLFELGGIVFSSFSLRHAASSRMTDLQNKTGATVLLGTVMEDQLVYVDKREGLGMIRISSDIGWRRPLHYGMLGMILMAYLDPKEVKRILKKDPLQAHTPFSITDEDSFRLRLEKLRKQGFLVETGEAVEGVTGVAAPIRDYSGQVIAALGIALTSELNRREKRLGQFLDLVKKACGDISRDLGYVHS
jgi:IclR family transcriptional regulator, KDG regulon repressor